MTEDTRIIEIEVKPNEDSSADSLALELNQNDKFEQSETLNISVSLSNARKKALKKYSKS